MTLLARRTVFHETVSLLNTEGGPLSPQMQTINFQIKLKNIVTDLNQQVYRWIGITLTVTI